MPRPRLSEMPQRQSTRAPIQVRTSASSISDPLHHRATTDRSPRLGLDRRSPRGGSQSDPPANQKKLGTRIADLESQLGQAQNELKSLKYQLASAEAAKKAAQELLDDDKKPKRKPNASTKRSPPSKDQESIQKDGNFSNKCEVSNEDQEETDVFEVPIEKPQKKTADLSLESSVVTDEELEKPLLTDGELALKGDEISVVRGKLEDRERELEILGKENESLKIQLNEKFVEISSAKVKQEEMSMSLDQVLSELETSKSNALDMKNKLEGAEKAKDELENEMKRLRIQTEQWRKAADAAAAILAGEGVEMNNGRRRLSERCGSMDKYGSGGGDDAFNPPPIVSGFDGGVIRSPGLVDDSDDVYGNGKRKSSGMRMFGDLWKKKGQK
ncbi:hypothetical protein LIER_01172 [Lithospermum erythrorhizon]|uniref:Interactor of constitutive active ROPs 4 n=1 Tax=Lithospermum erythrorhizon TaxID=34254 RepID=A0AAV3NK21_LITER